MLLVLVVLASPLFIIAIREHRVDVVKTWGLVAVGIAIFFGGVAVTSEQLVEQCLNSAYDECLDIGFKGLMVFAGAVYVILAWVRASAAAGPRSRSDAPRSSSRAAPPSETR